MNVLLSKLSISKVVQEFFKESFLVDRYGNLAFRYGGDFEYYTFQGHQVPVSQDLWIAGNQNHHLIRRVFICNSAMEAICFFSIHFSAYNHAGNLLFVATGLTPNDQQLQFIRDKFGPKKIALVMGNDLLGRVSDIKIAAGIKQRPVSIATSGDQIIVFLNNKQYVFDQDKLTLNALEKSSGLRSGLRTFKPKIYSTFLEQLLR